VCCSIQTHHMADAPPYEALSYCWGDITEKACIQCGDSTMEVTTNIFKALRHLRHPEKHSRVLWIDQICIDQHDLQERSYQVSIMRLIYYGAVRTIVWLGVADDKTKMAFDSVPRLVKVLADLEASKVEYSRIPNAGPILERYGLPSDIDKDKGLSAFMNLLQQPWFERIWVVQEVAVSKLTLLTQGNFETSWEDFAAAVELSLDLRLTKPLSKSINVHVMNVIFIESVRKKIQLGNLFQLRYLLHVFRHAKATDARDKIYGTVGLSIASLPDAPAPGLSYEQSVGDTYRLWTIYILRTEKSLEILNAVNRYKTSSTDIAYSWVPDWKPTDDNLSHHISAWPSASFQATSSSEMDIQFRDNETVLGLKGHVIDRIEAVGLICYTKADVSIFGSKNHAIVYFLQQLWKSWEATARLGKLQMYAPTGESIRDAFWQTVSFGEDGYGQGEKERGRADYDDFCVGIRKPYLFLERFKIYWSRHLWVICCIMLQLFRLFFSREKKEPGLGLAFTARCGQIGWRRVIRTQSGYIGLAVHCAEVGDYVALFKGARTPFVVRQDSDEWRLVGDSYVHGVMQGEAWQEEQCTTFWIR
jgi:Heterokaryon incompatibility protein (HET)